MEKLQNNPVHCFGFDDLPELYWEALTSLPFLSVYLFSPCVHFWEDLCTRWERKNLSRYWKRKGASFEKRSELDRYLSDVPPLLANWGKLGRETLKILDRFSFEIEELYAEPDESKTALSSLQREILFFERAEQISPDSSVQIFRAGSSKMNEVEKLRDEILRLAEREKISFSEIAVLAPDIQPYVPLIEYLFSNSEAPIPFRFPQVEIGSQSSFYQGLRRLFALVKEKWRGDLLAELIETPSFYRRQGWDEKKIVRFAAWVKEIYQSSGEWETGFGSLLRQFASLQPGPFIKGISLGDGDLLEEMLAILQALSSDLLPLRDARMSLGEWASRWEELANRYLRPDLENENDVAAWNSFTQSIRNFRKADLRLKGARYSFEAIDHLMKQPVYVPVHGNYLHAVRIGSIEPGAMLPAKALFLIGMDEANFPRRKTPSSLDLLKKEGIYIPERSDEDRYLILQALFSAQSFLRISYGHLSPEEGKPVGPSLLVQELIDSIGNESAEEIVSTVSPPGEGEDPPYRFTIRCPEQAPFEPERTVSISDLALFAQHPWKYHLRRNLGIYLEDKRERTFASQRFSLLRAAMKWPIEKVFDELPPGMFGEAFRLDVEKRASERQKVFAERNPISLLFLESAREGKRNEGGQIEMPPLEIRMEDGSLVRILGEANYGSQRGYLHFGEDKISTLLKSWPEILVVSNALGTSEIFFAEKGKSKTIQDPKRAIGKFLDYYFRCCQVLSPLLPDWADALLRKGPDSFDPGEKIEDRTIDWVSERLEIPEAGVLFQEWGWMREAFSDLSALYPVRGKKEAYEEV
jgi:exonuclease V gamma subunit